MLKLVKKVEQRHTIDVAEQQVSFTLRPGSLGDMDIAYVSALDEADRRQYAGTSRDNLFALRAGRELLLQRITAWEGVWLSETEREYLEEFFLQYPQAFQLLAQAVREQDEAAAKN